MSIILPRELLGQDKSVNHSWPMWEPLVLRSETCFLLKLTCHPETEKDSLFQVDRQSGDLTPAGVFPWGPARVASRSILPRRGLLGK